MDYKKELEDKSIKMRNEIMVLEENTYSKYVLLKDAVAIANRFNAFVRQAVPSGGVLLADSLQGLLEMQVDSEDMHENKIKISPEFRVAVQEIDSEKGVRIIIHANGYDCNTLDYWVKLDDLQIIDGK